MGRLDLAKLLLGALGFPVARTREAKVVRDVDNDNGEDASR